MDFTSKVISYINTNNLCTPNAKLIVGVSGGADSVALLHLLHHAGYQCVVAHCNFHLRGQDADEDECFVKSLAFQWKLPFFHIDFDTFAVAKAQGISIEMAARDLRYNWFSTLMTKQQADAIAVAHHLDDSIETFFINLSRGTGLKGLLGIQPKQESVIRPFLSVSRSEIDNYISLNKLHFRTDRSNFDQLIIRNKIRHSLIPIFESINASFKKVMSENFSRLNELESVTNTLIEDFKKETVADHSSYLSIDIKQLQSTSNIHFYLFEILRPYHFNNATIKEIIKHLNGNSGLQFFSSTHRIIKDRNCLLIIPLLPRDNAKYTVSQYEYSIEHPIKLNFSAPLDVPTTIDKRKEIACIDLEKLSFPLEIRRPEDGDYFYPLGCLGKKKLSDFFIDQKWNLLQKEQCWILTSDNQIVWIIGHRIDNRFRIDANTKKILKISFS